MDILVDGEVKDLTANTKQDGVEWTNDLLHNFNAQMTFDEDKGMYSMSGGEFEFWSDIVEKLNRINDLEKGLSEEEKQKYDSEEFNGDLEDTINQQLDWLENDLKKIRESREETKVNEAENISDTKTVDDVPTKDVEEKVNDIPANKDKTAEKDISREKSRFETVAAEIDSDRKSKIMEMSGRNMDKFVSSIESSAKLLPVLNMNRNFSLDKLKTFNQKNAALTDKISKNKDNMQKLIVKIEKLEAANEMLSSVFGEKSAPIKALINRNNARIEKIKDVKLPERQGVINSQLLKIEWNNKKIDREQCKVDKLESLSKVIGSFAIMNPDMRREQFSQAMNGLRNASLRSLKIKAEMCGDKIAQTNEKIQTASASEKLELSEKLKKQKAKIQGLTEKINALETREKALKSLEQQPQPVVDSVIESVRGECAKYGQKLETDTEAPNISEFSEDLSVSAAESAEKAVNAEKSVSAENKHEKSSEKKPSVLGEISKIKSEQSKTEKDKPQQKEQTQSKAKPEQEI